MARVVKSDLASIDLDKIAAYLTQERSQRTAIRFLEAADQAMRKLSDMPLIGSRWQGRNPSFADMRTWRPSAVSRTTSSTIDPTPKGIEVIRVLHGSQDVARIFEESG